MFFKNIEAIVYSRIMRKPKTKLFLNALLKDEMRKNPIKLIGAPYEIEKYKVVE